MGFDISLFESTLSKEIRIDKFYPTGVSFLDEKQPTEIKTSPREKKCAIKVLKQVKNNSDNRSFTVLDENPVWKMQNSYSIKRGNDYVVEFPNDEIFEDHWIKLRSNFFVVDEQQNIIGYVAEGNDKTARCFLMAESDKNKKSPIKHTLPCEFQIDLHTGEISNVSKRLNFKFLSNTSQTKIEQYCEYLIKDSKICKEITELSR